MQRSAATVAAYLMFKYGLGAQNAMSAIKSRKTETFWPTPTFAVALKAYEKQLSTFNSKTANFKNFKQNRSGQGNAARAA